jgi:hypothetical protein
VSNIERLQVLRAPAQRPKRFDLANYWLKVRLAVGRETEMFGEFKNIRRGGIGMSWQLGTNLNVELAVDRLSCRSTASSGFERRIARLTLRNRQ